MLYGKFESVEKDDELSEVTIVQQQKGKITSNIIKMNSQYSLLWFSFWELKESTGEFSDYFNWLTHESELSNEKLSVIFIKIQFLSQYSILCFRLKEV